MFVAIYWAYGVMTFWLGSFIVMGMYGHIMINLHLKRKKSLHKFTYNLTYTQSKLAIIKSQIAFKFQIF